MRTSLLGLVVAIALATALSAGAKPSAGPRTFGTRGAVERIAADGTRVAAITAIGKKRCGAAVVFDSASKLFARYDIKDLCPPLDEGGIGPDIDALVLSGKQVLWLDVSGGNKLDLDLGGATLGSKKTYQVAFAENGSGAEESSSGEWIANIRGQGGVVVYASFTICQVGYELDDCFEEDPTPGFEGWQVLSPELVKVAGRQKRAIRKDVESLIPVAVDEGRIALAPVFEGKPVVVVDGAGAVKGKIAVASPPSVDMTSYDEHVPYALDGGTLYVLRKAAVETYDVGTTKLTKKLTLPAAIAGGKLAGAADGLVALQRKGKAYVIRTSDGASVSYAVANAKAPGVVDAWLTGAGLFYAYNVKSTTATGRISFVPLAKITSGF